MLRDLRKVIIKTDRGECNKPQIHALNKCQTATKVLYQATNKQKYYHELKQQHRAFCLDLFRFGSLKNCLLGLHDNCVTQFENDFTN